MFSRSFFAAPDEMSAAELAAMFHIYFLGSSEGLVFDVPDAGFDVALWDPLQRYLAARDVEVRTGTEVTGIEPGGARRYQVHTPGGPLDADAVVLATDVGGLRAIVARSPDLDDQGWRDQVSGLRTAPPFLVQRLWLDRPVAPDRTAFLATGGLDPLDNISVLDRYDSQARSWAAAHGGSVVELHAYAAPGDPATPPDPALLRRTVARLHDLYPETATARVLAESVQWRADCPMFGVGDFSRRPRVRTPFPGLVLAGDGIRIDLPVALMERAASTGWHAANCLLARWGLAGHELYTVPTRGRLPALRWLATHAPARPAPQPPGPQPVHPARPARPARPGPASPIHISNTSSRTSRKSHTGLLGQLRGCIDELTSPSRPRGPRHPPLAEPLAGSLAPPADSPRPVGPPAADLRRRQTSSDRRGGQTSRGAPVRQLVRAGRQPRDPR